MNLVTAIALVQCLLVPGAAGQIRLWKQVDGRLIEGEVVSQTDVEVTLRGWDGREIAVRKAELSGEDREFLKKFAAGEIDAEEARIRLTNSLGMKFVAVPLFSAKHPQQERIKVIYASIWETRVSDFEAFVEEAYDPKDRSEMKENWREPGYLQGADHPVVMVNLVDAENFCKWLTWKERNSKAIPKWFTYRLPTDHEWSCMADIGKFEDPSLYPDQKRSVWQEHYLYGDHDWPPREVVGNLGGPERHEESELPRDPYEWTAPVGKFAPNKFGLYDLEGNVVEWCSGLYHKPEDRKTELDQRLGVHRGGSYGMKDQSNFLSSLRYAQNRFARIRGVGFRVIIDRGPPNEVQKTFPKE